MTGAAAIALGLLAAAPMKDSPMQHATGSFEVTMTPEAQAPPPERGVPTARMALVKRFAGAVQGEAIGTMLSAGTPAKGNAAAYVAIDQFNGTVDGRAGGFLWLHRGTMTKAGDADLSVVVAPDSGTGALAGITGTLTIKVEGGKHLYDFAYRLPAGDGAGR